MARSHLVRAGGRMGHLGPCLNLIYAPLLLVLSYGCWRDSLIDCAEGERFSEKKGDCAKLECSEGEIIDPSFPHRCIVGGVEGVDGGFGYDAAIDCDGTAPMTWYEDADGDGYGDPGATKEACSQPAGYVDNDDDLLPKCEREQSAQCTGGELRCGEALGARELCIEADGCFEWQPASACEESAPKCVEGDCGACTEDADCHRFGKVCDAGQCVQCTSAREDELCPDEDPSDSLAGVACDPVAKTCSGAPRGSVSGCGACVSDSECDQSSRCVPTKFKGRPRGNYCLPVAPAGLCPDGAPSKQAATSVLGIDDRYCFPVESLTICQAILGFKDACTQDSDCGAAGVDDGLCVGSEGSKRCAYACSVNADCAGALCVGPLGAKYCNPN